MAQWLERYRGILFVILIAAVIAGLVLFQLLRPKPAPIILTTPTPLSSPEIAPTSHPLRVYVSEPVTVRKMLAFAPPHWQAPAFPLQGFDSFHLGPWYQPHPVKLLGLDLAFPEQSIQVVNMIPQLVRCLLCRQKLVHCFTLSSH
jgi:hypothetical protein